MAIGQYIIKVIYQKVKLRKAQEASGRLSNFYMVEYCEIIKMAFSEILDFRRRLKIPSEAATKY